MAFTDTAIVAVVVILILALIWSRVMGQTMLQTFIEFKEMVTKLIKPDDE